MSVQQVRQNDFGRLHRAGDRQQGGEEQGADLGDHLRLRVVAFQNQEFVLKLPNASSRSTSPTITIRGISMPCTPASPA